MAGDSSTIGAAFKGGRSSDRAFRTRWTQRWAANFLDRESDGSFGPEGVCRFVSRLLLGHGFGALPAPGGDSLFCFDCIALRVTVSGRNLVRRVQRKDFSGASVNAELRPWEPGPSLGFAGCDPSRIGKFNKRRQDHVPEQSQPHRIPRQ